MDSLQNDPRDYLGHVLDWLAHEKHNGTWAGIAERAGISYSTLEKLVKLPREKADPHWSTVYKLLTEMDKIRRINALFDDEPPSD